MASEQQQLRRAILEALPADVAQENRPPDRQHVYVPVAHRKALRLEYLLVIGGRGVGKTFWSLALQDEAVRSYLGDEVPDLTRTDVCLGFGVLPRSAQYPDASTFTRLVETQGTAAYDVWRAVACRWLARRLGRRIPDGKWEETVAWVCANPEDVARLFEQANETWRRAERYGLFVFDALDRVAHDWQTANAIVRGLLRFMLDLKRFSHVFGKIFLREDQLHPQVTDFPDASKVLAMQIQLIWQRHDLHGLLWHYLVNAPGEHGRTLRALFEHVLHLELDRKQEVWVLPNAVRRDEQHLRTLFKALAGPWMGRDRRRGVPYTWIVNHLADAQGRVTPRSFLAAVREAAEDALNHYPEYEYPLHFESIKRGVQKASQIRVAEIAEDYPWVEMLMEPLKGLLVPCEYEEIIRRWYDKWGPPSEELFKGKRLPPEHWIEGWPGVMRDLEALGVLYRLRDGRVNMPDIYRIGFDLKRKGGVRPVR